MLLVLTPPRPAASFDYKIHPGSFCQPSRGEDAVHFIRGPGFLYHTNVLAPEPLSVTCPILRYRVPHWNQPSELTQVDIGVWFNGTARQTVSCTFHSLREDSSTVYVSPPQYTDPARDTQALYWLIAPEQTAIDGTYSINCQLPPYVFLLRYIAGEDKETDDGGF
jgi:hypothetical protein